jgi:hypothetical protein
MNFLDGLLGVTPGPTSNYALRGHAAEIGFLA